MNAPIAPLRGRLWYLQLGSADPERLARFYSQVFGMTARQIGSGWMCRGTNRCLVFSNGVSNTLLSAGYAAADAAVLHGLAARVATSNAEITEIDADLFEPGAVAFRDPDGNRIVYGIASRDTSPHAAQPSAIAQAGPPQARLQHVVVGSTDIARMVKFYTSVVGLRASDEVHDTEGAMRTCFMRSDDEHHSFAVFKTPRNRLDHHCYELPDWNSIRDWGDHLAALRIPVVWGPGRHGPGNNLFMFFHDPDGNWLELSAELEVVPADRPMGVWPHEERTLNSWGRGHLRS